MGVLPIQLLRNLQGEYITGVGDKFLNPASIDMPLSFEAFRLESVFLPEKNLKIRDMFDVVGVRAHDLANPLEVGVVYLIRVDGTWSLPKSAYGYANPKSSSGRVNLFCRLLADGVDMYDFIPKGWSGECWMLVRPDSFPIILHEGLSVAQLRVFDEKAFLSEMDMEVAVRRHGLLFDAVRRKIPFDELHLHGDSLYLTLAVGKNFGYECRGLHKPLDFGAIGTHNPADYFVPIEAPDGCYTLRKGNFYILSTSERVMVAPGHSAELRPIDPRLGEFRSHAAGYIDPGWGFGQNGEVCGRPITLEVIPHEDFTVRNGQRIARLRYERMSAEPDTNYDAAPSNYLVQEGPRLSKHFRT
ncbi:MAG: dCTP deaminase [Parcubacteria bacterium C7867-008]|nr:MAG: dCTP deaminase [Parcubacteria bacterium C7867-008]